MTVCFRTSHFNVQRPIHIPFIIDALQQRTCYSFQRERAAISKPAAMSSATVKTYATKTRRTTAEENATRWYRAQAEKMAEKKKRTCKIAGRKKKRRNHAVTAMTSCSYRDSDRGRTIARIACTALSWNIKYMSCI